MATNRILDTLNIRTILAPAGTNAARTGDRVNMENYDSAVFIFVGADSTATADLAGSLQQHTAATGGTSAAIVPRRYYRNQVAGNPDAGGSYSEVAPGTNDSVANSVLMEADMGQAVVVEVGADELDNDKPFISANLSAGHTDKVVAVMVVLAGARRAVSPDHWPAVAS